MAYLNNIRKIFLILGLKFTNLQLYLFTVYPLGSKLSLIRETLQKTAHRYHLSWLNTLTLIRANMVWHNLQSLPPPLDMLINVLPKIQSPN